jgi:2-polyprenyl-3-methyl-5-hydroxy-6-metoxy-1,4-benzoquinol methylase
MEMQTECREAIHGAEQAYYRHSRREIRPLLPAKASRVLEVGSGGGYTLRWIRSLYENVTTVGVEINEDLRTELTANADVAVIGNIDECVSELGSFDLILLLDVLEHLPDPGRTLQALTRHLERNGRIIVSVPNVAHLSVALPLLLARRFEYQDSGILDRTHLRFFVESTAVKLLNDANLLVFDGLMTGLEGPKSKAIDQLSLGIFRHHLAKQYIMAGSPCDPGVHQPRIGWRRVS